MPFDPIDPEIVTKASDEDLVLAITAIGHRGRYGGLLACALAGVYAERKRQADLAERERELSMGRNPMTTPTADSL